MLSEEQIKVLTGAYSKGYMLSIYPRPRFVKPSFSVVFNRGTNRHLDQRLIFMNNYLQFIKAIDDSTYYDNIDELTAYFNRYNFALRRVYQYLDNYNLFDIINRKTFTGLNFLACKQAYVLIRKLYNKLDSEELQQVRKNVTNHFEVFEMQIRVVLSETSEFISEEVSIHDLSKAEKNIVKYFSKRLSNNLLTVKQEDNLVDLISRLDQSLFSEGYLMISKYLQQGLLPIFNVKDNLQLRKLNLSTVYNTYICREKDKLDDFSIQYLEVLKTLIYYGDFNTYKEIMSAGKRTKALRYVLDNFTIQPKEEVLSHFLNHEEVAVALELYPALKEFTRLSSILRNPNQVTFQVFKIISEPHSQYPSIEHDDFQFIEKYNKYISKFGFSQIAK